MPVPQLLASVFLGEVQGRGVRPPGGEPPQPLGLWRGPHRSKKEARRRRSRTLWRVPALTWQFMSCALVMYTLVPAGGGGERIARADQDTAPHPNNSTHSCLLDTQERRETVPPATRSPAAKFLSSVLVNPGTTPMKPLTYANVAKNAGRCSYLPLGWKPTGKPLIRINMKGCQGPQDPTQMGCRGS